MINWTGYCRGGYGSYGVPWPGTKSWSGGCGYRRPRTTQERRKYEKGFTRPKRNPANLVDTYDDLLRGDIEVRSWKRHRKTQYKPVDMGA